MFGKENVEKMAVEKGIFLADLTSQLSHSLFCTEQPLEQPFTVHHKLNETGQKCINVGHILCNFQNKS